MLHYKRFVVPILSLILLSLVLAGVVLTSSNYSPRLQARHLLVRLLKLVRRALVFECY
jgi:hypothetical protein